MSTSRRPPPDSTPAARPRFRRLRWRLLSIAFSLALTVVLGLICEGLVPLLLPQATVLTLEQRELGIELFVLSIPQQFQVLYYDRARTSSGIDVAQFDAYYSGLAERTGYSWVMALEELVVAYREGDELFFRLDGHLTPAGNRVVAEVFVSKIGPKLEALAGSTATPGPKDS